ncbi:MerR family transcriptional regulator [Cytobacillus oceanisediminis]|uniref:MerR family transcriptional regulator n=1 Tax=Cytobacillus oceanisediminis TaxID=665099 RepID=UPI001FB3514E|nr:MerR family transcriptional regulator [Cytobacillus oceanisediminis]UOE58124.1 MerR family transcriptional regulator [Cytobacillus oceanisediminis]
MAVEVEFITMGTASEQLGVPAPTLRLWTDQLEEYEVHYVMRNDKNERLYYDTDLEIFAYLRDLKKEHGRKTTTKDLAYMIFNQAKDDNKFTLRTKQEVPHIEPTNAHLDLLNQKDIQNLLGSDRVRQLMGYIKEGIADDIRKEISEEMMQMNQRLLESHERIEKELRERNELLEKKLQERDEQAEKRQIEREERLVKSLRETMDQKKGLFARLFGG